MKNLVLPVMVIVILIGMFVVGIATSGIVLVITSCGAWTPAMIAIGYFFAWQGISARRLLIPMGLFIGLGGLFVLGLSSNLIPLMMVSCGATIPALLYAGWSLARAGDGITPIRSQSPTRSTILTDEDIKRLARKKLAHLEKSKVRDFE